MPAVTASTLANRVRRLSITIPANASTAVTLESLAVAAMNAIDPGRGDMEKPHIIGGAITVLPAAIIVGDSTTSLPLTVAILVSPDIYTEPSADFLKATFAKAAAGGTVAAVISVYLAGDGIYAHWN